ncbi:MAG: hypothetical protein ACOC33_01960 [bacterium]
MLDLTTTDSVYDNLSINSSDLPLDYEDYINMRDEVFKQITQFENLGIDLLKDCDLEIKRRILIELIEYTDENYISIADIDNILISDLFIDEIGYYIYLFFAVDCFNSIFPNFIKLNKISSFDQFERLVNSNFDQIKNKLLKSLKIIIDPLIKLQTIDPTIIKDIKYQAFFKRLTYHIDLIDYGDSRNFIENFMIPVFRENFNGLIWRSL